MHGNFLPEIRERVSDCFVIPITGKQLLNKVHSCKSDDLIILNTFILLLAITQHNKAAKRERINANG